MILLILFKQREARTNVQETLQKTHSIDLKHNDVSLID